MSSHRSARDPRLPDLDPIDTAHRADRATSPAALALLERIVATPRDIAEPVPTRGTSPARKTRRVTSAVLAAGAAAALALGAVVVVLDHDDDGRARPAEAASPAAVQLVLTAARTTASFTSLRMSGSWTSEDDTVERFEGEVDGDRSRTVIADGATYVQDGTDQWYLFDGIVARETTPAMAPFPQAAAAVVTAVTQLGSVQDLGTDTVGGQPARHYRVQVGDPERAALAALPVEERGMFGLEHTDAVSRVDVWVSDGLIVKTAVKGSLYPDDWSETEYRDFGADITIDVPTAESSPEG